MMKTTKTKKKSALDSILPTVIFVSVFGIFAYTCFAHCSKQAIELLLTLSC